MLGGSSANSCSILRGQRDCESVLGCIYIGHCLNTIGHGHGCEVLSQSDCESERNFPFCIYSGSCWGTPWTRTAAEGEALLSLEAAADDPNYDYDYDYDPYGAPDALPNANDSAETNGARTNLRGWNQERELQ
jgi:hypothetical protein